MRELAKLPPCVKQLVAHNFLLLLSANASSSCFAMQKLGLEATGILAGMSKAAGFGCVSELLNKNPLAKRPASATQGAGAKA